MDKAELKTALNLGQAAQIGCVVRDVSETIKHYEETIGIGPRGSLKPRKLFIIQCTDMPRMVKICMFSARG